MDGSCIGKVPTELFLTVCPTLSEAIEWEPAHNCSPPPRSMDPDGLHGTTIGRSPVFEAGVRSGHTYLNAACLSLCCSFKHCA